MKLLAILKGAFLAAGVFALVAFGAVMLEVRHAVVSLETSSTSLQKLSTESLATLTDTRRLIVVAGVAASEAQKASAEERQFLTQANGLVAKNLTDLDATVVQSKMTLGQAQLTLADLDTQSGEIKVSAVRAMDSIAATATAVQLPLEQTTKTLQDASMLLSSPEIQQTLLNIDGATANIEHTTVTLDAFATRITKPASVLKTVLFQIIGWTASAGSWFK